MADNAIQQQLLQLQQQILVLQKERNDDARALNDIQQTIRRSNIRVIGLPEIINETGNQLDTQFRQYIVSLGVPPAEVESKYIYLFRNKLK
jgi:hypothetical protein